MFMEFVYASKGHVYVCVCVPYVCVPYVCVPYVCVPYVCVCICMGSKTQGHSQGHVTSAFMSYFLRQNNENIT